ncbi:lytic transglycosylase domain-containing protein [Xanthobacter sediminis]
MALLIACTVIASIPSAATAERPVVRPSAAAASFDPWADHIAEAVERFAIPERWIRAVMTEESGGDATLFSPKGAIGLMQLMPATWEDLRAKYDLGDDPWEPRANILAGAALLRQMHDRYGSIDAMLAAYSAGPARYDEHLKSGRALPAETIAYLVKVTPMIGGAAADALADHRDEGPSWQRAPLFVARSPVTSRDHPMAANRPSPESSNGPAVVDLSALTPPSDGVFVSRLDGTGAKR